MDALTFSMSGEPRGKGRPRATVRGGFARVYTDPLTRKYEASIRAVATAAMAGHAPFQGPLSVSVRLRLEPPASMSKRLRAAVLAGEAPYMGRIDADNGAKAVLDALNGVCFGDDKQIMRLFVTKAASATPGVDVRVEPLAPQAAA